MINQLAADLPGNIPFSQTLGPYSATIDSFESLGQEIVTSCYRAGYVDSAPPEITELSLTETWQWLAKNAFFPQQHTFLIFLDIEEPERFDLSNLATLFSDARRLEGVWDRDEPQLLIVISGYWDPQALNSYFVDIQTSFPYTSA